MLSWKTIKSNKLLNYLSALLINTWLTTFMLSIVINLKITRTDSVFYNNLYDYLFPIYKLFFYSILINSIPILVIFKINKESKYLKYFEMFVALFCIAITIYFSLKYNRFSIMSV